MGKLHRLRRLGMNRPIRCVSLHSSGLRRGSFLRNVGEMWTRSNESSQVREKPSGASVGSNP